MIEKTKKKIEPEDVTELKRLSGPEKEEFREKLRRKRREGKYGDGIRQSARLLTFPSQEVMDEEFSQGNVVFINSQGKPVRFRARTYDSNMVMPIEAEDRLLAVRSFEPDFNLSLFEGLPGEDRFVKPYQMVSCNPFDTGHMILPDLERRNITLPLVKIARDHAVAAEGKAEAPFVFLEKFLTF